MIKVPVFLLASMTLAELTHLQANSHPARRRDKVRSGLIYIAIAIILYYDHDAFSTSDLEKLYSFVLSHAPTEVKESLDCLGFLSGFVLMITVVILLKKITALLLWNQIRDKIGKSIASAPTSASKARKEKTSSSSSVQTTGRSKKKRKKTFPSLSVPPIENSHDLVRQAVKQKLEERRRRKKSAGSSSKKSSSSSSSKKSSSSKNRISDQAKKKKRDVVKQKGSQAQDNDVSSKKPKVAKPRSGPAKLRRSTSKSNLLTIVEEDITDSDTVDQHDKREGRNTALTKPTEIVRNEVQQHIGTGTDKSDSSGANSEVTAVQKEEPLKINDASEKLIQQEMEEHQPFLTIDAEDNNESCDFIINAGGEAKDKAKDMVQGEQSKTDEKDLWGHNTMSGGKTGADDFIANMEEDFIDQANDMVQGEQSKTDEKDPWIHQAMGAGKTVADDFIANMEEDFIDKAKDMVQGEQSKTDEKDPWGFDTLRTDEDFVVMKDVSDGRVAEDDQKKEITDNGKDDEVLEKDIVNDHILGYSYDKNIQEGRVRDESENKLESAAYDFTSIGDLEAAQKETVDTDGDSNNLKNIEVSLSGIKSEDVAMNMEGGDGSGSEGGNTENDHKQPLLEKKASDSKAIVIDPTEIEVGQEPNDEGGDGSGSEGGNTENDHKQPLLEKKASDSKAIVIDPTEIEVGQEPHDDAPFAKKGHGTETVEEKSREMHNEEKNNYVEEDPVLIENDGSAGGG